MIDYARLFNNTISSFEAKYIRFTEQNKYYHLKLAGIIILFSILHRAVLDVSFFKFFSMFFKAISNNQEYQAYEIIRQQSIDLVAPFEHLGNTISNADSHYFKMKFRIFMPLLVRVFHIGHVGVTLFLLQFSVGFVFISLLIRFFEKYSGSKINSLYLICILATIYPITACWTDLVGYGDSLAFFFLFLAVYSRNPLLIFLSLLAAFFIDERALVNSCFVFLWYFWIKNYLTREKPDTLFCFNKQLFIIVGSWVVYFGIRFYLDKYIYSSIPHSGSFIGEFKSTYYENLKILGLNIWRGYKGSFCLFILLLIVFFTQGKKMHLLLFFLPFLFVFNFSFIAYDISRSMGYCFLATAFCYLLLAKEIGNENLNKVLVAIFLITLTLPNFSFLRLPLGYALF